jgi:hypothetical protein
MPHSPKTFKSVVIAYAPAEVIDYFYLAERSPHFSESPYYEELEPNENEVKKSHYFSLHKRLIGVQLNYWTVVLKHLERYEQKDASSNLRFL